MTRTLVVLPSYSGRPDPRTTASIRALKGCHVMQLPGCSDVSLARNRVLSLVLTNLSEFPTVDKLLMVDDDIVFGPDDAEQLLAEAHVLNAPVSAVYTNAQGFVCARRMNNDLYLTGLGFFAMPLELLVELSERLEPCEGPEGPIFPFCTSGPALDRGKRIWESDDFSFCRRLGGVHLMPLAVGHCKTVPLYPDEETIRRVAADELFAQLKEDRRSSDGTKTISNG
jgi:hypothetical protein